MSRKTTRKGLRELEAAESAGPGDYLPREGGGRKKAQDKDQTLRSEFLRGPYNQRFTQDQVSYTINPMHSCEQHLGGKGPAIP